MIHEKQRYRVAIGRNGFSRDKKEGDGCTPVGIFPLRECWYRPDRLPMPSTTLPHKIIHKDDGWCHDPKGQDYNRPIRLPNPQSHEALWRQDHIYDLFIPLGYNDSPPVPGKGSAIFLHFATEDYLPTDGCIAMAKEHLLYLLPYINNQTLIRLNPLG